MAPPLFCSAPMNLVPIYCFTARICSDPMPTELNGAAAAADANTDFTLRESSSLL